MTDVYTARYYYSCYIKRLFKIAYSEAIIYQNNIIVG